MCYLAGDFNIDLLKSDTDNHTKDFFDTLTSNLFVPHITLPTRITNRSQTLIDNIFSNNPEFDHCTSGNFTFSISDHLAQFLIVPSDNKKPPKAHNIRVRDTRNYSHEELVADIINVDWNAVLDSEKGKLPEVHLSNSGLLENMLSIKVWDLLVTLVGSVM